MTKKFRDGAVNPFDDAQLTMEEADAELYGEIEIDENASSLVAYPVDIDKLIADRTQPRRAVPLSIRKDWDGNTGGVSKLLTSWHMASEEELNRKIPILKILMGKDAEIDIDPKTQPIADRYMALVKLANGIQHEGLLNPIQINRAGIGGMIVAGERRWLAHHLLKVYVDHDKYAMIPAYDVQPNVWKQAQENGNRSPLNAIEMARQLALLIMDMYQHDDGVQFDSFDALVSEGHSDRAFYAQARPYHIKRGLGDRVKEATGLKSKAQVQQYRDLLNLDDKNWRMADENNWKEGRCRRILHPEQLIQKNDRSTTVDLSPPEHWQETDSPTDDSDSVEIGNGTSEDDKPIDDSDSPANSPTDDSDTVETVNGTSEDDKPIDDSDSPANSPEHIPGEGEGIHYHLPESKPKFTYIENPMVDDSGLSVDKIQETDPADLIALITYHKRLRRLLNNIDTMAMNLNMIEESRILEGVTSWTTGTIKTKVKEKDLRAVQNDVLQFEEAIKKVFNALIDEWEELKYYILTTAESEQVFLLNRDD